MSLLTTKLRRAAGLDEKEAHVVTAILDGPAAQKALRDFDTARAAARDQLIAERQRVDEEEMRALPAVISAREAAEKRYSEATAAMSVAFEQFAAAARAEKSVRHRADYGRARLDREIEDDPDERISAWREEVRTMLDASREFRYTTIHADDSRNLLGQPIGKLLSNRPAWNRHREAVGHAWQEIPSLTRVPSSELTAAIERRRKAIPPLPGEHELEALK